MTKEELQTEHRITTLETQNKAILWLLGTILTILIAHLVTSFILMKGMK